MSENSSDQYKMLNSPIKWVGGKSRLRRAIIPIIPPHSCYVEPFAGAAWVLFGKPPSDVEVLNDIDQELVNFFRMVKENPEELMESFHWDLVSRAEFIRLTRMDTSQLTEVQRAHRFYYLIMAGWGGEARYPRFQTSVRDGGHGNRLIGALKTLHKRLAPIHQRLSTVIIENLDWRDCLDRYDSPFTVMYLDPPYLGNGVNYKHNMRNEEEHLELSRRLSSTECKWILSSYNNQKVKDLFGDYFFTDVQSSSGMKTGVTERKTGRKRTLNREVLITNFIPAGSDSSSANTAKQGFLLEEKAAYN